MSPIKQRILTYDAAIREALFQKMEHDSRVIILGQGVKSPWYVGQTTKGLYDTFGSERVIDTPVSENAMTGVACGAALAGLRPIIIHPRMDFMLYAVDQIVNEAANWHSMFGGAASMPLVIRPIVNRGGEQGAQHSQALHAWFAHVPGLKVVMPATPYDAKGLLITAINDNNPVMYIDDRWLYGETGNVPEELYEVPLGHARIAKEGTDITVVAISAMVPLARAAAHEMNASVEVIDIRTIKPLDTQTILHSVKKTGRILIADSGWRSFGAGAEIAAQIAEFGFKYLKKPILRVALPDAPSPVSARLEKAYYPSVNDIKKAIHKLLHL